MPRVAVARTRAPPGRAQSAGRSACRLLFTLMKTQPCSGSRLPGAHHRLAEGGAEVLFPRPSPRRWTSSPAEDGGRRPGADEGEDGNLDEDTLRLEIIDESQRSRASLPRATSAAIWPADAGRLGDKWHRARRTRVDFQDVTVSSLRAYWMSCADDLQRPRDARV